MKQALKWGCYKQMIMLLHIIISNIWIGFHKHTNVGTLFYELASPWSKHCCLIYLIIPRRMMTIDEIRLLPEWNELFWRKKRNARRKNVGSGFPFQRADIVYKRVRFRPCWVVGQNDHRVSHGHVELKHEYPTDTCTTFYLVYGVMHVLCTCVSSSVSLVPLLGQT